MLQGKHAIETTESNGQTIQLMEFTIAGGHFGINVAKVFEILKYTQHPITPMPNSNPFVEGIFRPRTDTMTVINLASYLGLPPSADEERDILIITKLNNVMTAFHVHGVESIEAVKLSDIEKPDPTIYGGQEGISTGIAKHADKLITIIDFEKVLFDISPSMGFNPSDIESLGSRNRSTKPILVAEDSPLLERLILSSLEKAGFESITFTSNGQEAWNVLQSYKDKDRPLEDLCCCVVTDLEMPIIDGHTLLKNIKGDPFLRRIPVIVFSSLISDDMRAKGAELGASASISKPEIANLITIVDNHIL